MKAIISGATRGIGKATAYALAGKGYDLALGARNMAELEQLKKELETKSGVQVFCRSVDFSSRFETGNFAQAVLNAWGPVDVIVNNVGTFSVGVIDKEEGVLDKMMHLNFESAYYLTLPFLDGMRKARKGHIFNICSAVNKKPRAGAPAYTISKYALKGFNDVLREEMRQYNVKVTAIVPGSVNTSSWEGSKAPREQFVQPQDVASVIVQALNISSGAMMEEIVLNPLDKNF